MLEFFRADELYEVEEKLIAYGGAVGLAFAAPSRDRDALLSLPRPTVLVCDLELDLSSPTTVQTVALAFSSIERRALYRAVRSVNGIGRASALGVLECGEVADTLRAVAGGDRDYFKPVPLLGDKRVGAVITGLAKTYKGFLPKPIDAPVAALVEAREALVADGLSGTDAELRLLSALAEVEALPRTSEDWLQLLA